LEKALKYELRKSEVETMDKISEDPEMQLDGIIENSVLAW